MSRLRWIAVVLIVVTLGLYAPTAGHGYIALDDELLVTGNDMVRAGLTADSVRWAFGTHAYAGNWHPLTWLSHMLDIELFGIGNPGAQHAVNVMLHVLATLLLLLVMHRLTGDDWASGFVAACFALHPQHVESVAWISERKDVLAGLFWMLTLWAYATYVQRRSRGFYALTVIAFALGLMVKPVMVTLPCVLLLLDVWPLRRVSAGPARSRSLTLLVLEKLPLFALTAASSLLTMRMQRVAMGLMKHTSPGDRIGNACVAYASYLGDMLWPAGLAIYYPHPNTIGQQPLTGGQVAVAVAVLTAISGLVVVAAWRGRLYAIVGWFWFLGTLVPMIGLIQVGDAALADRYVYLPSIGISLLVAFAARDLVKSNRLPGRAVLVAGGAVVLSWSVLTYRQVTRWSNEIDLFSHAAAVTTNNSTVLTMLGGALHRAGRVVEAEQQLRAAIAIDPGDADARLLLGYLSLGAGRHAEAATELQEVLRLEPDNARAMLYLGQAQLGAGNIGQGLLELRRCLRLGPAAYIAIEAHGSLAEALGAGGDLAGAVEHYEALLQLAPDTSWAVNNLGWILATNPTLLDPARAVDLVQRLCPEVATCADPGQLDTAGVAHAAAGDFARAIAATERALTLVAAGDGAPAGLQTELEARLELYRSATPYREP